MFTKTIGQQGQTNPWMSKKAVRLAAVLGTLILMSIAVNALIIVADDASQPWSSGAGNRAAITEKAGT